MQWYKMLFKQKWNDKTCQCECKNVHKCEKDYIQNFSTCICENSKYLSSVVDTAVTEYDEIVIVIDNLSTKKDKYYSNKSYEYLKKFVLKIIRAFIQMT